MDKKHVHAVIVGGQLQHLPRSARIRRRAHAQGRRRRGLLRVPRPEGLREEDRARAAQEGRLRRLPRGARLRPEEPARRRRGEALLRSATRPGERRLPEGPRKLPGGEQGHLLALPRPPLGRAARSCSGARSTPSLSGCDSCHAPANSPKPFALQETGGKLCAGCHDSAGLPAGGKVEHAPFKKGDCIACHDPHASNAKKLARVEGNALCTGCHKPMGEKVVEAAQARHHGRRLRLLPQAARVQAEGAARHHRRRQLRGVPRQGDRAGPRRRWCTSPSPRGPASPATIRTAPTSRAWARGARTRPATPATRGPRRSS